MACSNHNILPIVGYLKTQSAKSVLSALSFQMEAGRVRLPSITSAALGQAHGCCLPTCKAFKCSPGHLALWNFVLMFQKDELATSSRKDFPLDLLPRFRFFHLAAISTQSFFRQLPPRLGQESCGCRESQESRDMVGLQLTSTDQTSDV